MVFFFVQFEKRTKNITNYNYYCTVEYFEILEKYLARNTSNFALIWKNMAQKNENPVAPIICFIIGWFRTECPDKEKKNNTQNIRRILKDA